VNLWSRGCNLFSGGVIYRLDRGYVDNQPANKGLCGEFCRKPIKLCY
jgi:hypothetical protein